MQTSDRAEGRLKLQMSRPPSLWLPALRIKPPEKEKGPGSKDLLVGQFGDGILWFYKNIGTNERPRYAAGVKFKEGKPDGRVPTA